MSVGRDQAGEHEVFLAADALGQALETLPPHTVAHEQKPDVGNPLGQAGGNRKQVFVTFQLEQSGDFANHKIVV